MMDSPENANSSENLTNHNSKDADDHTSEGTTQTTSTSQQITPQSEGASSSSPPLASKPVSAPAALPPASAPLTGSSDVKDSTQSVVVALRIRPLTSPERAQGCKDCITVIPCEPQIQLGSNFFTFDHVYGSTGSRSSDIFDECVAPLIDGLFQGYNATVLAYGQTGSGKTYTMGTAFTVGDCADGITPRVMEALFKKVEKLKDGVESQLRVSFIEILKEEVHDLLDPNPAAMARPELSFLTANCKNSSTGKPVIQIRETTNGEIMVAGVREVEVANHQEMALCLEQGALCRATGSTNMNATSSRSHAIFTITLEQRKKLNMDSRGTNSAVDDIEDFLCAKLHLVDLAGSERAKRTGTDGLRFKEGVHINKGLLALGNVISALCDERKRKEGGHIPYRDSKLTRILQDSLGGNSRTVMIACVSPADVNAEETLNTLKYANRARNIQNKPVVNRDPIAAEMQRMRQQLELLQAELACARAVGSTALDTQRIAWLEASNAELQKELQDLQASYELLSKRLLESQVERDKFQLKIEYLKSGKTNDDLDENENFGVIKSHLLRIQELEAKLQQLQRGHPNLNDNYLDNSQCMELVTTNAEPLKSRALPNSVVFADDEAETMAKEWEHNVRQDTLGRELQQLNKCLEQKEAEMRNFLKTDPLSLRHHFEKKLYELEEEKKALQKERDILLVEMENLVNMSDEQTQKMKDMYAQKLKSLEAQIAELKRNQESQSTILRQKHRSEEAAKHLQEEIHRMKAQRVNLVHKIKQEADAFRLWRASRERELFQLKKEGRKNEFEMKKLHMLNQRQKMVLQRKTEEAAAVTRRLKELLEVRKHAAKEGSSQGPSTSDGNLQINEKELQQWLGRELEVAVRIHEVRTAYEKQSDARASIAKELEELKMEEELNRCEDEAAEGSEMRKNEFSSTAEMARRHRISLLDSLLNASSTALVNMAAELSDAEERERSTTESTKWPNFQNLAQAKQLLQLTFNAAASARCQLHEMELENNELNNKITALNELLKHKDVFRRDVDNGHHRLREPSISMALLTSDKGRTDSDITRDVEELSIELTRISQARVSSRFGSSNECSYFKSSRVSAFPENLDKVVSTGHGACMKQDTKKARPWKWKWNQQWWMLHLRWWQKPWLFPEWMKHTEKSHTRIRSGNADIGHLL